MGTDQVPPLVMLVSIDYRQQDVYKRIRQNEMITIYNRGLVQYYISVETDVIDERNFARFELKMSFGHI